MVWINQLRLAAWTSQDSVDTLAPTQPRAAQPHRYAPVRFPTATNWCKQEVC
jgi:hypothetical protein